MALNTSTPSLANYQLLASLEQENGHLFQEIRELMSKDSRTKQDEELLESLREERSRKVRLQRQLLEADGRPAPTSNLIPAEPLRPSTSSSFMHSWNASAPAGERLMSRADDDIVDASHATNMIEAMGGNMFTTCAEQFQKALLDIVDILGSDDCKLWLCGAFCTPCQLATSITEMNPSENWWIHCLTLVFSPRLLGIPYFFVTIPSLMDVNSRLGGVPTADFQNKTCFYLCCCRPCFSCQLARAVNRFQKDNSLVPLQGTNIGASTRPPQAQQSSAESV